MSKTPFLVCLKEGHRFASDQVEDMTCPLCGGDLLPENRILAGLGPEPGEKDAESDLPEEVAEANQDPDNRIGDFILVRKVGEGSSGKVYKAWQLPLRRYVALKFLSLLDDDTISRFEREAQLLAQLHHPNIAGVHEISEKKGRHFLVMHFIDGPPIHKAGLSLDEALKACLKVCRSLDFAHGRAIIHRDIKPGNILVDDTGEPYVTDFDLAKILQADSSLSGSRGIVGTPLFMPPEQARGNLDEIDARSDIYSLGATLYQLVTGRPPFDGPSITIILAKVMTEDPLPPRKIDSTIPPEVEAIILKAMEKEKSRRYASAGEMAEDLDHFLQGGEVAAKPPSRFHRLGRGIRRNPWPLAAAMAALLAAIVLLVPPGKGAAPVPDPPIPREEENWRSRFEPFQKRLDYHEFETSSPGLVGNARRVLAEMPKAHAEEISNWFRNQANRLPKKVWPKSAWLDRKSEAGRIRDWCRTIGAILEGLGGPFDPVRTALAATAANYALVEAYRGKITLKILFRPWAELCAFRVGDDWIVRKGEKLGNDAEIAGEELFTPLVIRNLDIGEYTLTLSHPELGRHEFTIGEEGLENGSTCLYSGSLNDPDSVRLRILP